jgi:hypothetical protein
VNPELARGTAAGAAAGETAISAQAAISAIARLTPFASTRRSTARGLSRRRVVDLRLLI